jgi:hypothetical protein
MTRVFIERYVRSALPLLALAATLTIGGTKLVRCWGNENKNAPTPEVTSALQISFDDLKLGLNREKPYESSLLTDKIRQLEGKTVRIRGFVHPADKSHGITYFVLVRDHGIDLIDSCSKCIVVDLVSPATLDFVNHAIDVEGVFSLREVKTPEGDVVAIYHLDGKKTELVPSVRAPRSKNGC